MSIDPFAYPAEYEPADRIFTRPSHNESAARAEQARNLLDSAQNADHRPSFSHDAKQFNYADGVEALRDALAGQGQATLAVHAELARIATALETIAKTPAVLAELDELVAANGREVKDGLADIAAEVESCYQATMKGSIDVAAAIRETGEILEDRLSALDRPRWWQRRLRRDATVNLLDVAPPAQETKPAVDQFLVEIRRCDRADEVLGRVRFHAEYEAACDTAGTMLPGLCAQLGVPADPDQVYGRVSRCDPAGIEGLYVGFVFLPGATVLDAPPEGF